MFYVILGGEALTVYLDVLLGINLIVNYFLLLLTFKLTLTQNKNLRVILGAGVGSLFSLYIFISVNSIILDSLVKIVCSALMVLTAVGFINIKAFLRNIAVLFAVSFLYSGCMMALWSVFRWETIVINNSTVYLDISPLYLIGFSVLFYITIVIIKSILKRNSIKAERCRVKLIFGDKKTELIGIFDTGNSVKDIFSDSAIIFISNKDALSFLGDEPKSFKNNYRLLPCSTVTGSKLLEAVRIDKAQILLDNKSLTLYRPILAITTVKIDSEYSVLLNPEILLNAEENYVTNKNSRNGF